MSDNYAKDSSEMVCVASGKTDTVAETSAEISKKISDCGVKTITAVKDYLKIFVEPRDKKTSFTSQAYVVEPTNDEQEIRCEKAARALIAALESDLAAVQCLFKDINNNAERTYSKLASELAELKVEKEILLSDLKQAKCSDNEASSQEDEIERSVTTSQADLATAQPVEQPDAEVQENLEAAPTEEEALPEIEPPAQSVEQPDLEIEEQSSSKVIVAETPPPPAVTDEEVQLAVFSNATDKIIFSSALSDITNQNTAVRVDAAKTMAAIPHELSTKALAAQMVSESSLQVRQECIKALVKLEMAGALPAIEHALTDESGSVRLAAVWGLYQLAGAESAPALIRMFADNDEEIRRRAATCIGWLGAEELAVELLPLLDDESISVRRAAVEAMGNLHNKQVVALLIDRLDDPDESFKKVILHAIETITGKKMSESLQKNKNEIECLIAQWKQWRREQISE